MKTHLEGDLSHLPAGEDNPLSWIQTDTFCRSCAANLYGLAVWKTPETDLLVVRCGRCGALNSASEAMPYRQIWRRRMATALVLVWLGLLATGLAGWVGGSVGLYAAAARQVQSKAWEMNREHLAGLFEQPDVLSTLVFYGGLLAGGTLAGSVLMSAVTYHWPKLGHVLAALAVPLLALAIAAAMHEPDASSYHWTYDSYAGHGGVYGGPPTTGSAKSTAYLWTVAGVSWAMLAAPALLAGLIGAAFGRPVVRGLLRAFLPQLSRGYFAHLWRRDGKTPPGGAPAEATRP